MWSVCYLKDDCDVDKVMDGLKIDRGEISKYDLTKEQMEKVKEKIKVSYQAPTGDSAYTDNTEGDEESEKDSDAED